MDADPMGGRCPHGYLPLVVCPECDPGVYERARPQAERFVARISAGRRDAVAQAIWRAAMDRGATIWPDQVDELNLARYQHMADAAITAYRALAPAPVSP